ncbi:MAG: hypothetical protein JWL58_2392, partial [Streptosporangiaceae bacterium]|nr:hypothetical protein [Streptosporangiaceae bacterium]
ETPDFYIAPAPWGREVVKHDHALWLQSVGGVRPRTQASDHTAVHLERIKEWHQRWDVLANMGRNEV